MATTKCTNPDKVLFLTQKTTTPGPRHVTTERIRGRRLQRRRQRFLRQHPLCAHCELKGAVTVATQVDHIIALTNGGPDTWNNLQGLCDPCHEAKTRADLGQQPGGGCDLDGLPTDPRHPWNQRQAGVIEWILIAALALGVIGGAVQMQDANHYETQDQIRQATPDDGRVDW